MSRTKERARRMALLNAGPLMPAVTSNEQQGQLIPLKGDHFLRRDTYDIAIEENDEFLIRSRNVKSSKPRPTRDIDPEDSPLSEDELEAVYGGNASPIRSSPHQVQLSEKTADQQQRRTSVAGRPKRRRILQPDAQKTAISSAQENPEAVTFDSPISAHRANPGDSHLERVTSHLTSGPFHGVPRQVHATRPHYRSAVGKNVAKKGAGTKPSGATVAAMRSVPQSAVRRLSANELLLVKSPSDVGFAPDPRSSDSPDAEAHDPIQSNTARHTADHQDACHRRSSPIKAPLTSLRRRIKKPKSSHKSIGALQRKALARAPFFKATKQTTVAGDGFEVSEMKVTHPKPVVKRRRGRRNLAMGFSTLTLKPGPLPAVEFLGDIVKEQVKAEADAATSMEDEAAHAGENSIRQQHSAEPAQRRTVTFSDHALDKMMSQRLSSVTAPKRVYSISSDESEDECDGLDDWNQSEIETHQENDQINNKPLRHSASFCAPSPRDQHVPERSTPSEQTSFHWLSGRARSTGVQFDFRKFPASSAARTPLDKRYLIEVDEVIMDEPDTDVLFPANNHGDDEMLEPNVHVVEHVDRGTPLLSRPCAPRSILRRKSSMQQECNSRPENTAANTRRNSARLTEQSHYFNVHSNDDDGNDQHSEEGREPASRRRNTEINLDESRYFSQAAGRLQQASSKKPRIIKQRSSEARRASWLSQQEVLIPDSDTAVLESSMDAQDASPGLPDYTNFSKQNVLMRNGDTTWTSSNVPRMYKDLKTLTRAVSQEHGTLSQSVRRKSSLSFRSPTKVK
ncbi:hypothetical protein CKM354_000445500 [Cercospora kikuchii]|uniref:Uncharacterized protein n=1 Tax=Cercospora kikuchii TaxID=84275 RepID=A0A9P3CJX5_9PEZI|nr:uncharacterized protein CKM354_000445500 [Cercospora kikuchii]GIZ41140.1 hypothetical protein CKM354_000445500 [Cercospora kikuchii]